MAVSLINSAPKSGTRADGKPKTKISMYINLMAPKKKVVTKADGTSEEMYIPIGGLGSGIGLENILPMSGTGQFAALANKTLNDLYAIRDSMKIGEEKVVMIPVVLRRVDPDAEAKGPHIAEDEDMGF